METMQCYYCGKPATTEEHVPPKCLFPDAKGDLVVPSCYKHNNGKSADDEYLRFILVSGSNGKAAQELIPKITRATVRKPKMFLKLLRSSIPSYAKSSSSELLVPTRSPSVDVKRMEAIFSAIALGLYFHLFNERWLGRVGVTPLFMRDMDTQHQKITNAWIQSHGVAARILLRDLPYHGKNKDVFSYRYFRSNEDCLMEMTFYGDRPVIVYLSARGG